jgi:UDP-N-acetylmuramoyl-L-alanyl-D-glutamate--2,6-diaminopimelate ligase
LRFGVESGGADVRCEAYELRPDRTELFVRTPEGALSLEPRLRGRFNIDNVLCAVTLALLLHVPLGAVEYAVASTDAPPGRFEPVEAGQGFGVIVDYAHTPAGIAAVLASARPLASGRLLCVFGAGGDRDQAKRPKMGAAAEAGADRIYVTSDNSRSESSESIAGQILAGLERPAAALVELDRRRAIARALEDAGPGDLVLILGKGHEQGQDVGGIVEPFDDRTVAQELLGGGG